MKLTKEKISTFRFMLDCVSRVGGVGSK